MAVPPKDGRALRFAHRRPELLDAVMAYVCDHGIAETSLRKLADASGVSHVTLRHHFGTKEELVAEVCEVIRERQPVPQGPFNGDPDLLLTQLWETWTGEEFRAYFRMFFEVYGQALMHPERYARFLETVVAEPLPLIETLAVQSGCPAAEASAFATLLVAQIRGLLLDLLTTHEAARVNAAFDVLMNQLRRQRVQWELDSDDA